MKTQKLLTIVLCFLFVCPVEIIAQTGKVHHLDKFVGEFTHLIVIEHPGTREAKFGKVAFELTEPNTLNAEFENHNIEFTIEYNPLGNNYLFTYKVYDVRKKNNPIFSIDGYDMAYTEEESYSVRIIDEEKNLRLEVEITHEEKGFQCYIDSAIDDNEFKHLLKFFRSDS